MEKEIRPVPERKWKAKTDKVRLSSSQKFQAIHEKDSSPRSPHTLWTPRTSRTPRIPRAPSNKQKNDRDLLSQSPEPGHNIDKTSDRENQVVSDKIQRPDESRTPPKTLRSSSSNECDGLDSQTISSGSRSTVVDASTVYDLAEWQFNSETRRVDGAPHSPHSSGSDHVKSPDSPPGNRQIKSPRPQSNSPENGKIVNFDSQPNSPGRDQIKSPDPRPFSSGGDLIKSPTPQPQSPVPGGVAVQTSPTQDQVEEEFDADAWLNSPSHFPGNYKAIFPKSPGSMSSDSSTSGDSLIVSTAMIVRLPCSK